MPKKKPSPRTGKKPTRAAAAGTAASCRGSRRDGAPCRNTTTNQDGWCGRCGTPPTQPKQPKKAKGAKPSAGADPFGSQAKGLPAGARFDPRQAEWRPAHPNNAIEVGRGLPDLSHLGQRVVTVDADGTIHDPWACCGHRGNFRTDSETGCTHLRSDTIEAIRQVCEEQDAVPVILSWRAGLDATTREWLADCGLDSEMGAVFVPGGADDISQAFYAEMNAAKYTEWDGGQVVFKAATVRALQETYGISVVAAFDDNPKVVDALGGKLGVPDARVVPRLVTIEDHEWRAGYIGAPKPAAAARPRWVSTGAKQTSFGFDPYNDTPPGGHSGNRTGTGTGTRSGTGSGRHDRYGNPDSGASSGRDWDDDGLDPDEWWDGLGAPPVVEGDTVRSDASVNHGDGPFEGIVVDSMDPYSIGVRSAATGEIRYLPVEDLLVRSGNRWEPAVDPADFDDYPDGDPDGDPW